MYRVACDFQWHRLRVADCGTLTYYIVCTANRTVIATTTIHYESNTSCMYVGTCVAKCFIVNQFTRNNYEFENFKEQF